MVEQSAVNRLVVGSNPSWGGFLVNILYTMNISTIELYLYNLQQITNNFLIDQLNNVTFISFFTILIGGILTSFNPCMLSSIPIAIAYINKKSQRNLYSFVFLVGILSSIILISFLTFLAQTSFSLFLAPIPILKPLITILIGLSLLNLLNFSFPSFVKETQRNKSILSVFEMYIGGLSIGLNLSPCSTPILMTVIAWISSANQLLVGVILLSIYTVGYILPIIVSIISLNHFKRIRILSLSLSSIIPVAGCLITSIGSFSFCYILLTFTTI